MKKLLVHEFRLGDCEDPEIYAAQPIYEWQQTDKGKWIMEHAHDPTFHIVTSPMSYQYIVRITAELDGPRLTEYYLRFG